MFRFSSDIKEFLRLLSKYKVQYVMVGGEAVIYYGHGRLTGDIDIFYHAGQDNADRMYRALDAFWQGDIPGVQNAKELMEPGCVLQFGVPPNRIDLINLIDGVSFEEAWTGKKDEILEVEGGGIPIHIIGLDQLIKNKKAVQRYKDLDDLAFLVKAKKKKKNA